MDGITERLCKAVQFLKRSRYAKSQAEIAKRIGVTDSTLSMDMSGSRHPTLDMVVELCKAYPISIEWLCLGTGSMIRGSREEVLMNRIEALEERIRLLARQ